MNLRRHVWSASDVQECRSVWPACCPGEWPWVDSNGINGKPTFRNVQPVVTFHRSISLGSYGTWSRKAFSRKVAFLEKNDPLWETFQKFVPKGFVVTQIHVLCANFVKFSRRKLVKSRIVYLTKKQTKFPLALTSAAITPTICEGQQQTVYSESPKFHPNWFTSGEVIAERVNIVQTRHKVFQYSAKLQLLRRVNRVMKRDDLTTLETRRLRGYFIEVFEILKGYENINKGWFFDMSQSCLCGHSLQLW